MLSHAGDSQLPSFWSLLTGSGALHFPLDSDSPPRCASRLTPAPPDAGFRQPAALLFSAMVTPRGGSSVLPREAAAAAVLRTQRRCTRTRTCHRLERPSGGRASKARGTKLRSLSLSSGCRSHAHSHANDRTAAENAERHTFRSGAAVQPPISRRRLGRARVQETGA